MTAPQVTKLRVISGDRDIRSEVNVFTFYVRHNDDLTDEDIDSFIERAFLSHGTRSTDKPYLIAWYYVPEIEAA